MYFPLVYLSTLTMEGAEDSNHCHCRENPDPAWYAQPLPDFRLHIHVERKPYGWERGSHPAPPAISVSADGLVGIQLIQQLTCKASVLPEHSVWSACSGDRMLTRRGRSLKNTEWLGLQYRKRVCNKQTLLPSYVNRIAIKCIWRT
jgi:hypothetical protein